MLRSGFVTCDWTLNGDLKGPADGSLGFDIDSYKSGD